MRFLKRLEATGLRLEDGSVGGLPRAPTAVGSVAARFLHKTRSSARQRNESAAGRPLRPQACRLKPVAKPLHGNSAISMSLNSTFIAGPACNCSAMIPSSDPLSLFSV